MKITCLIDDCDVEGLLSEHGLSFYIETESHKILFDLGQSQAFIENAKRLNIDLSKVDMLVISHGHYDHGGGLKSFLEINDHANVYIQEEAFKTLYSIRSEDETVEVGLDDSLKNHPRLVLLQGDHKLDDTLMLVNQVDLLKFYPKSNQTLLMKKDHQLVKDDFSHEQSLLIRENNHYVLFAGCAHKGIYNIIKASKHYIGYMDFNMVIGGFHLKSRLKTYAWSDEELKALAQALKDFDTNYYTGHCTGEREFESLKKEMDRQIHRFYSGWSIQL